MHLTDRISRIRNGRVWWHAGLAAAAYVVAGSAVGTWAWNSVAHELFGLPQLAYRQAVAILCAVLVLALPFRPARPGDPGS